MISDYERERVNGDLVAAAALEIWGQNAEVAETAEKSDPVSAIFAPFAFK